MTERRDGSHGHEHDGEGDHEHRDQAEIDRQWQQIVEGLGPLEPSGSAPEPLTEERPGLASYFAEAPVWGPRDYTVNDEDEGDFVPPDPPALAAGRPAMVLSAVGLIGGPAALLLSALFWPGIPGIVITVFIAAFVAGAVGLFLSLPRDQDRRDPWNDDGAQV
ncbi:hypothetical protein F7P69_06525 [Cellulosimicrobium funkei]|nr:hypothetical protein [Cellulosimicrobium funkei]